MSYNKYAERLDYLLEKIKKERLSSPKEIAERFECSEKTVRNMINNLRNQGFDIDYCRKSKKYFLKN